MLSPFSFSCILASFILTLTFTCCIVLANAKYIFNNSSFLRVILLAHSCILLELTPLCNVYLSQFGRPLGGLASFFSHSGDVCRDYRTYCLIGSVCRAFSRESPGCIVASAPSIFFYGDWRSVRTEGSRLEMQLFVEKRRNFN